MASHQLNPLNLLTAGLQKSWLQGWCLREGEVLHQNELRQSPRCSLCISSVCCWGWGGQEAKAVEPGGSVFPGRPARQGGQVPPLLDHHHFYLHLCLLHNHRQYIWSIVVLTKNLAKVVQTTPHILDLYFEENRIYTSTFRQSCFLSIFRWWWIANGKDSRVHQLK